MIRLYFTYIHFFLGGDKNEAAAKHLTLSSKSSEANAQVVCVCSNSCIVVQLVVLQPPAPPP